MFHVHVGINISLTSSKNTNNIRMLIIDLYANLIFRNAQISFRTVPCVGTLKYYENFAVVVKIKLNAKCK